MSAGKANLETLCANCGYDQSYHEDEMGKLHRCASFASVRVQLATTTAQIATYQEALNYCKRRDHQMHPCETRYEIEIGGVPVRGRCTCGKDERDVIVDAALAQPNVRAANLLRVLEMARKWSAAFCAYTRTGFGDGSLANLPQLAEAFHAAEAILIGALVQLDGAGGGG